MITNVTRFFKNNMFKNNIATAKVLPLIAIAIASAATIGNVIPSLAQTAAPTAATAKQHKHNGDWAKLNLTDSQKAQLKSIREATKAKIDGVLTQAQKDQLAAAKGDRQAHGQAWKSLNLTDAQKAAMKQIRSEAKQQSDAVYTPAQLQQLQQMRQNHKAHAK